MSDSATMLGIAAVIGVALLIGFRAAAGPVEWIAAIGVLAITTLALTWLSVALGMVTKSVEAASNLPHAPAAPAAPRQRIRRDGLDAGRDALVHRAPAVHAHHRYARPPSSRAGDPERASQVVVRRPAGTPVRASVSSGLSAMTMDDQQFGSIGGPSVLHTAGWTGTAGYHVRSPAAPATWSSPLQRR